MPLYLPSNDFPPDLIGLDYESAVDAMPRWYGVSSGNGNDGVSHLYPDYYVRTCEPYRLAELAMVTQFNDGAGKAFAAENLETDGEADYTITCMIRNPPDDGSDRDHSECENGEDCEGCEECIPDSDYCDANGAWQIIDVFPVDESDMREKWEYASLSDAFGSDIGLVDPE